MNRRSFATGMSLWALAQLLAGCQSRQRPGLRVHALQSSVPPQLVGKLRNRLKSQANLKLVPEADLATLFTQLQTWKLQAPDNSEAGTGLATLGDYWLATAIQQELIQPLQPDRLSHWQKLPDIWQQLVTRDRQGMITPQGLVWAAPYRWGMTVLAYRKDKFRDLGWQPADWSDLWRPELQRRFSLLDQPREVIGLTLKHLGYSYNTEDLASVSGLRQELLALQQQAKFYSSDTYLQPLLLGDTWLAVGWSNDILPILSRSNQIAVAIPQSGTALWSDLWVQSARLPESAQTFGRQWIDFWWQPQVAQQLTNLSSGISPLLSDDLPMGSGKEALSTLDTQTFERSEFLRPLSATAIDQYQKLWLAMRKYGATR